MPIRLLSAVVILLSAMTMLSACTSTAQDADPSSSQTPGVGDTAPDFRLSTIDGKPHALSGLTKEGPVVLIALRGYIGKQCPLCTRQVGDFLGQSEAFAKRKTKVVLVYPGPANGLDDYAKEFIAGHGLPEHFVFLVDPDFEFTNRYAIRWDTGLNTAYPATFVVAKGNREVRFAKVSSNARGRSTPAEVIAVLDGK